MDEILPLRRRIDEIDEQILHLLKERVSISKSIGTVKQKHEIPIRDRRRRKEVYAHVMKRSSELGLNPLEVKAVYRGIIAMCTHVQETNVASPPRSNKAQAR